MIWWYRKFKKSNTNSVLIVWKELHCTMYTIITQNFFNFWSVHKKLLFSLKEKTLIQWTSQKHLELYKYITNYTNTSNGWSWTFKWANALCVYNKTCKVYLLISEQSGLFLIIIISMTHDMFNKLDNTTQKEIKVMCKHNKLVQIHFINKLNC